MTDRNGAGADASVKARISELERIIGRQTVPDLGRAYLMVVRDWFSRKVVGWQLSLRCRIQELRGTLEDVLLQAFPPGVRGQRLKLISENGCQPGSRSCLNLTAALDIEPIFTSLSHPKGNTKTERFMRTLQEELLRSGLPKDALKMSRF